MRSQKNKENEFENKMWVHLLLLWFYVKNMPNEKVLGWMLKNGKVEDLLTGNLLPGENYLEEKSHFPQTYLILNLWIFLVGKDVRKGFFSRWDQKFESRCLSTK